MVCGDAGLLPDAGLEGFSLEHEGWRCAPIQMLTLILIIYHDCIGFVLGRPRPPQKPLFSTRTQNLEKPQKSHPLGVASTSKNQL
jgi:hypothetical protein